MNIADNIAFLELINRFFIKVFEKLSLIVGRVFADFLSREGKGIFVQIDDLEPFFFIFLITL